jgi:hypothetical protein
MWGCALFPALGCFTPNQNYQMNTSQGKADYAIISTIFHCVRIFVEYQYSVLYENGTELQILGKGEEISYDVFSHFV